MNRLFLVLIVCLSSFLACEQAANKEEIVKSSVESTNLKDREQHRPIFHFTPPNKWMNDPNGMVYFEGEYHLFYQHYPDSTVWGPMHWGHAVSTDLVHWTHLPIALYPDSLGLIFSGSAVIDWNNTSGLGKNGQPPMIAIYTYHHMAKEKAGDIDFQYQGMAYSNDKGRTWTKYENNPIIPNPGIRDFRDPKVIWDEDSNQWVMVFAAWDHVKFYGSPDLQNWEYLSDFGREWGTHSGVWECPDLFPMEVEGTQKKKWVLLQSLNPGSYNGGSGTQYFVGHFDGKTFKVDPDFAKALGKVPASIPTGTVFADFENGYGDWKIEGEAFGTKPANGRISDQNEITGFTGNAFVNSFYGGDKSIGKLTSPEFKIEKDFINLQVGGGNDKLRTCINLLVGGKVIRSASGSNGEQLRWTGWDVSDLKGQTAHFEVIDNHTGGWGHINVDQITFADALAKPESEKAVWLDYGRDNYAGVTWSDIPANDGRRIFMGWMSNWDYAQVVPTESWRSAMTLPRTLKLAQTDQGLRLLSQPVAELKKLQNKTHEFAGALDQEPEIFQLQKSSIELILEAHIPNKNSKLSIELSNQKGERYTIGYNAEKQHFFSDRTQSGKVDFSTVFAKAIHVAPYVLKDQTLKMHLFFDVASVELFAQDGLICMTDVFFPNEDFRDLKIFVEGEGVVLKQGKLFEL